MTASPTVLRKLHHVLGRYQVEGPGFCPRKVAAETQAHTRALYDDPETLMVSLESARVEAEGYCQWTRVEEIVQFAKKMEFKKVGIANCISFVDHAYVLSGILESHGFEVVSLACKNGNIPKEALGLADSEKIRSGVSSRRCATPWRRLSYSTRLEPSSMW